MFAIPCQQPLERVNQQRQPQPPQHATEHSGTLDLREECDSSTLVTGNWRAVAKHDPPAFASLLLWHGGKQTPRLFVPERKERELLASVKPGDDPRRPATKPSAAGIEQNRSKQLTDSRCVRPGVLSHFLKMLHTLQP